MSELLQNVRVASPCSADCPVGLKIVMRRVSRIAGIALSAVMSAASLAAAPTEAFVQGQVVEADTRLNLLVLDIQGTACAGAKVELKSESNQEVITAATNIEGMLRLAHLPSGTYALTVTFPGFYPYKQTVTLSDRQTSTLKATLKVAVIREFTVKGSMIEIPSAVAPPLIFEPVPVPRPAARRGFFRRTFDKLFHHSR